VAFPCSKVTKSCNCWELEYSFNPISNLKMTDVRILGKLYAVGGSDGTHSLTSTEVYDAESQSWTPGPSMTTPRANVGVSVIGNRLYAVGGFSGIFPSINNLLMMCSILNNFN